MIKNFRCKHTEALFLTGKARRFPVEIWKSGERRLRQLNTAKSLMDLKGVGNSLELLDAKKSRYALRVNDKFRLCFIWKTVGIAEDVEIVDYHP
jgi:proteic killer suppression protein